MATAEQVVKAALQRILVQDAEAPLTASETQDTLFAMNNLMLSMDAEGIALGYTEISNLGEEVTIPPGALRGLIAMLAIEISPDFAGQITAALQGAAIDGLKAMRKLARLPMRTRMPSTLSVGSGNYTELYNRRYYPCSEDEILAETTGAIALESGTNEAAE